MLSLLFAWFNWVSYGFRSLCKTDCDLFRNVFVVITLMIFFGYQSCVSITESLVTKLCKLINQSFIFRQKCDEYEESSQLLLTCANEREKVTKLNRLKTCSKIIKVIIAGKSSSQVTTDIARNPQPIRVCMFAFHCDIFASGAFSAFYKH